MRILHTLALACVTALATHGTLQAATATTETPQPVTAGPQPTPEGAAQESIAEDAGPQPTPEGAAQESIAEDARPIATQQWEFTPYQQLAHLRGRDFRTAIIPYQKAQELREASLILVDTSMLFRSPPPFTFEVSEDEPLEDVLNRMMPDIYRVMRRQEPFVIVIKRDSIQRLMVIRPREGQSVTAEKVKHTRISPGDIIVLDMVGY